MNKDKEIMTKPTKGKTKTNSRTAMEQFTVATLGITPQKGSGDYHILGITPQKGSEDKKLGITPQKGSENFVRKTPSTGVATAVQDFPAEIAKIQSVIAAAKQQSGAAQSSEGPMTLSGQDYVWTTEELMSCWVSRTEGQKGNTTQKWQATQFRFLFLLAYSPRDREQLFDLMSDAAAPTTRNPSGQWSHRTRYNYWSAFIAGAASIGAPITPSMKATQSLFQYHALCEKGIAETMPLSPTECKTAVAALAEDGHAEEAAALQTAFILGQRLGDVLNLLADDLTVIRDPSSQVDLLCICFRQTKTCKRVGPYTLHIPAKDPIAIVLLQLAEVRKTLQQADLLIRNPRQPEPKRRALEVVNNVLKIQNPGLNILSIRRGGLQTMALMGCSQATLMAHSRHRTVDMLNHYLDHGKLNFAAARERFNLSATRVTDEQMSAYTIARIDTALYAIAAQGPAALEKELLGINITESLPKSTTIA